MRTLVLLTGICLAVFGRSAIGQNEEVRDTLFIYIPTFDTTEVHRLGEVTVGGYRTPSASVAMTQRISLAQIENRDAFSASEVLRIVPAAHIQTNSRGETLVYLRNAGERQVALFLPLFLKLGTV